MRSREGAVGEHGGAQPRGGALNAAWGRQRKIPGAGGSELPLGETSQRKGHIQLPEAKGPHEQTFGPAEAQR